MGVVVRARARTMGHGLSQVPRLSLVALLHLSSFAMRWTVPVPMPSDLATFRIPVPFASCFRTCVQSERVCKIAANQIGAAMPSRVRERRATVQETAWSRNLSVMMWRCPVVPRVHRPLTFFANNENSAMKGSSYET